MTDASISTATDAAGCPYAAHPSFPFKRDRSRPLDPPAEYGDFRHQRPVSQVTLWDGSRVWLVTRHEDAHAVLGDKRFSSVPSNPGYPLISPAVAQTKRGDPSFLRMDPPKHTDHRRMWTPFFAARNIQKMRPTVQEIVDRAIDAMLAKGPPADLVGDLALVVPSSVICLLLDVPYSDHEFFQANSLTRLSITSTPEQVTEAFREIDAFWLRMIEERENSPGDDLISQLIVNEVATGRLTKRELVSMAQLMLLAGHETTANMIALGTLTLLRHPDQLEAMKADPSLTPGTVDELLRYLSIPQNGLGRAATEDVEIGGQLIRKGEGVLVLIAAANRDESVFPDPDRFDIRRAARQHMTFGAGIHLCIGNPLARMELQIVFDTLFRRMPTLHVAIPPEDVRYKFDSLFYGLYSLPVSW
ncbi:MAG TPA: cytochrome P450 [Hyphomicrobiales bacterium]|nr:cytochrome P450 [Hyphomicrobiales bacterium]